MIRLLDRYVLGIFLSALAVFSVALLTLFTAIDAATKMASFLELKNVAFLPFMARYYLCRLPLFFYLLSPILVLLASMFTVVKLGRTNEILPIAASGTSLRRMAAPFVAIALLASGGMAALDEYVLPKLNEAMVETEELRTSREVSWSVGDYDGGTNLWGNRYDHVRREMTGAKITRVDDQMQPVEVVTARRCVWDAGRRRWVAYEGEIEYPKETVYPEGRKPHTRRDPIGPEGYVVQAPFTPETLRKSASFSNQLPADRMRDLLEKARRYPHVPSHVVKVHTRLAFPLSPPVLLLLGLPFVVSAHSKSFLTGLFGCFLLGTAYYLGFFACLHLGIRGVLPAVPAAWGPTAAFGLVGVVSFARMRT